MLFWASRCSRLSVVALPGYALVRDNLVRLDMCIVDIIAGLPAVRTGKASYAIRSSSQSSS
jgi:hypothetical protein